MADGDKHVSLAGLKAVYDHLNNNANDLKGASFDEGVNLIPHYEDTAERTDSQGITWSCEDGVFTVSGSTSSIWFVTLAGGTDSFPDGIRPGDTLYLEASALNGTNVFIGFRPWRDGASIQANQQNKDFTYTVPEDATGLLIRLEVPKNRTLTAPVVYRPVIRKSNWRAQTLSRITSLETGANAAADKIETLDGSVWAGKTWYCYGTSMSDTEIAGTGKYPPVVETLSGMVMHNYGIGSGGICPSLSHGGNVKTAIMNCPWDVDLVTFEVGANDIGSIDLGEIGDESDNTYAGNFTQCLKKLTLETRAKVVFILISPRTFTDGTQTYRQNPNRIFSSGNVSKPYSARDAADLELELCRLYGVEVIDLWSGIPLGWRNKATIVDHVHNTDAGGLLYGTFIWEKLKRMMPCNVTFTQNDIGEVW